MAQSLITSHPRPDGHNLHAYSLPKGMLRLQVWQAPGSKEPSFRLEVHPHAVPDPQHRYYLSYRGGWFSDESFDVGFSPEGYLSSLNRKAEDLKQQASISISLPSASANLPTATKPGPAPGSARPSQGPARQGQAARGLAPAAPVLDYVFDPFDPTQRQRAAEALQTLSPELELHIQPPAEAERASPPRQEPQRGILCRSQLALPVLIKQGGTTQQQWISLPSPQGIQVVEVPKQGFFDHAFRMAFDEWGHPAQLEVAQSSWLGQLFRLLLRLGRSIMEIPAQIFQLRIDMYTNKQALAESQIRLAEALHQQAETEAALGIMSQKAQQQQATQALQAQAEIEKIHLQLIEALDDKRRLEQMSIPIGKDLQPYDLRLQVIRYSSGQEATLGLLFDITKDRVFLAYTLEDQYQKDKVKTETRIPAGTYAIKLRTEGSFHQRYSQDRELKAVHKGMLHLQDVPNFTRILIHGGNDDDDTAGCLLVGNNAIGNVDGRSEGAIQRSMDAYRRIYPPIAQALLDGKTVGIEYLDYDTPVILREG